VANDHFPALVLVGNQGCDVRFDATSSKSNDNDGDDEAAEPRAMVKSCWNRSTCQDEKTDHVHAAEDDDGVVFSEVLISDNGT